MISILLCNKNLDCWNSIFLFIAKKATAYDECEGGIIRLHRNIIENI